MAEAARTMRSRVSGGSSFQEALVDPAVVSLAQLLTLWAWCRLGSPVPVRHPLMSSGRYWIWRSPRRRVLIRWAGSVKAVLAWQRLRSTDQMPSTGLSWGAYGGR